MEDTPRRHESEPITHPTWDRWVLVVGAVFLVIWHARLTAGLFGDDPWPTLLDDRPIVSGAYPQHLYLGSIGAEALRTERRICIYDTAFQAGYPKTPIFDGARLTELFLLAGGAFEPAAAQKLGLALCFMLVPLLVLVAARAMGLNAVASLGAGVMAVLIWWSPRGRAALESGDLAMHLASLAGLAHVGLLCTFDRTPSIGAWVGLFLTGTAGWFLQPLLFPMALPLLLIYYLSIGDRHDLLTWHLAFWCAELGAIAIHLPWFLEWIDSWWLRTPLPSAEALLLPRSFTTLGSAAFWGSAADRLLALLLFSGGLVGLAIFNQSKQRAAARLLTLGGGGALALALLRIAWEPLGVIGTLGLLLPAMWFATIPCALGVDQGVRWLLAGRLGRPGVAAVFLGLGLLLVAGEPHLVDLLRRAEHVIALRVGLSNDQQAIVDFLCEKTTANERIFWEDRPLPQHASRWSAMLPRLTQRAFLGGLDPDGFIEHSSISLLPQVKEGRPPSSWSDAEIADYCRRYNVGWAVVWSKELRDRLDQWEWAEAVATVRDGEAGILYRVRNAAVGFALKGQATLHSADTQAVTLTDVVPVDGVVVLSLHYQAGLRASPGRVQIEREPSGDDPIGFIRLRLAQPVARVQLTWDR